MLLATACAPGGPPCTIDITSPTCPQADGCSPGFSHPPHVERVVLDGRSVPLPEGHREATDGLNLAFVERELVFVYRGLFEDQVGLAGHCFEAPADEASHLCWFTDLTRCTEWKLEGLEGSAESRAPIPPSFSNPSFHLTDDQAILEYTNPSAERIRVTWDFCGGRSPDGTEFVCPAE